MSMPKCQSCDRLVSQQEAQEADVVIATGLTLCPACAKGFAAETTDYEPQDDGLCASCGTLPGVIQVGTAGAMLCRECAEDMASDVVAPPWVDADEWYAAEGGA